MAPMSEQTKKHIDGIVAKINNLLDKRFAQARRIQPKVQQAEADMRFHQIQVLTKVIAAQKGFGPIKLVVADILASADEEKKSALFSPVDQVSILNEIIPQEEQESSARTAGRLKVRSVLGFYNALDASLASVLELLQTWMWWDLRDASEMYRFDNLEHTLIELQGGREPGEDELEYYRQEMGLKAGTQITKQEIIKFELKRLKYILDRFAARLAAEEGHQVIIVSQGREATPQADACIMRLGKRLQTIEAIRAQGSNLDAKIRQHYAQQLSIAPEEVRADRIIQIEQQQADTEREKVAEYLSSGFAMQNAANFKAILLERMQKRFGDICASLGVRIQVQQSQAEAPLL